MRKNRDYEAEKEALMKQVKDVLQEVENLYQNGVDNGTEEAKQIKARAQEKLGQVKAQFADFEAAAAEKAREAAERARENMQYAADKAREGAQNAADRACDAAKQTNALIQEKPYYAMGFAALAGLVVGALLNRR